MGRGPQNEDATLDVSDPRSQVVWDAVPDALVATDASGRARAVSTLFRAARGRARCARRRADEGRLALRDVARV